MASLSEQMTILQKQQAILAEKIKQEEERKRKQQLTLQTLQKLNKQQNDAIKTYKSKDGKYRGKFELQQTNLMTAPRFEVILEILKKQDERIVELEAIITKIRKCPIGWSSFVAKGGYPCYVNNATGKRSWKQPKQPNTSAN